MAVPVLPDVLAPGLDVVFCGSAVSTESASAGAYYAGRCNKFWPVLNRIRLTPKKLDSSEFREVGRYGIGLTDLNQVQSGPDNTLSKSAYDVEAFRAKIKCFAPRAVAFNGKKAGAIFYGRHGLSYGQQEGGLENTAVFILPSTSGAARSYWEEKYWIELADFVH